MVPMCSPHISYLKIETLDAIIIHFNRAASVRLLNFSFDNLAPQNIETYCIMGNREGRAQSTCFSPG